MLKRVVRCLLLIVVVLMASMTVAAETPLQLAFLHGDSYLVDCHSVSIASLDGSPAQDFILPTIASCSTPLWSPDGRYLALATPGLTLLDMKHGTTQIIIDPLSGVLVGVTMWSQDGDYLVWDQHKGYTQSWVLMNMANGSLQEFASLGKINLASGEVHFWNIEADSIQQDHIRLYRSGQPLQELPVSDGVLSCHAPVALRWDTLQMLCADNYDISRLDANTRTILKLTDTPDLQEYYAEWSPDGTQIAYQVTEASSGKTWLQLMASDGSNVRRLTHPTDDTVTPVFMVSSGDDTVPHWSQDGQYIAFQHQSGYKGLESKVYIIKADGSDLQYVGDGIMPTWRPVFQP